MFLVYIVVTSNRQLLALHKFAAEMARPKWRWDEMALGRNGAGTKWRRDEMAPDKMAPGRNGAGRNGAGTKWR